MQYLEVMHNVSMRLGRMDVLERAVCRLFILSRLGKMICCYRCKIPRY